MREPVLTAAPRASEVRRAECIFAFLWEERYRKSGEAGRLDDVELRWSGGYGDITGGDRERRRRVGSGAVRWWWCRVPALAGRTGPASANSEARETERAGVSHAGCFSLFPSTASGRTPTAPMLIENPCCIIVSLSPGDRWNGRVLQLAHGSLSHARALSVRSICIPPVLSHISWTWLPVHHGVSKSQSNKLPAITEKYNPKPPRAITIFGAERTAYAALGLTHVSSFTRPRVNGGSVPSYCGENKASASDSNIP